MDSPRRVEDFANDVVILVFKILDLRFQIADRDLDSTGRIEYFAHSWTIVERSRLISPHIQRHGACSSLEHEPRSGSPEKAIEKVCPGRAGLRQDVAPER